MDTKNLEELLLSVQSGSTSVGDALHKLRDFPYANLGFANIDTHRAHRVGFPEVIYGAGKTAEQIEAIAARLSEEVSPVLVTRVAAQDGPGLASRLNGTFYPASRAILIQRRPIEDRGRGEILIISAGTSDLPVAEEARVTAEAMGNRVRIIQDIGVAGIHRVLSRRTDLENAEVLIVVAGMEGALPSVVGGLTARPVIAVPTSVGYGASFHGLAALLGMLNSCAAGVTVVNIDNGFGAAYAASLINRKR
jgi:NCAIR mutase (PurE)-related protein